MAYDYLHYRFFHWKVGEYINLKYGEKKIAHAYMSYYLEQRRKEERELGGE